jgi:hypothetical protein
LLFLRSDRFGHRWVTVSEKLVTLCMPAHRAGVSQR